MRGPQGYTWRGSSVTVAIGVSREGHRQCLGFAGASGRVSQILPAGGHDTAGLADAQGGRSAVAAGGREGVDRWLLGS